MTDLIRGMKLMRLSREETLVMQTRLLRKQLEWARTRSPWYRKKLAGIDIDQVSADDLSALPFTTKEELSEHFQEFFAVPESEIAEMVFTSGTTGSACPLLFSHYDMARLEWNEERALKLAGITKMDRVLTTCTIDRCFIAGIAYYLGLKKIGACAIRGGLNAIEGHFDALSLLKPTVVIGVPSFLRRLGLAAREHGISLEGVRLLLLVGEPIRTEDLALNHLGREVAEIWNADVRGTYASSEICASLTECAAGCGGHVPEELVVSEIVDKDGRRVPDGEPGELIQTPLQVSGMPLVRFRTGDVTFLRKEPCACGLTSPRVGPILGRLAHMLKCRGTTLFPQTLNSVLQAEPGIADFYVTATSGDALSDRLEVVVAQETPGHSLDGLRERLRAKCRVQIPVRELSIDAVRAKIFNSGRKPIRFFDLREDQMNWNA